MMAMEKITVKIAAREQRLSLMHASGASGVPRWTPEPQHLISQADYVTLCVAQRTPKQSAFLKFRLIRLLTSGRSLSVDMVAQQLCTHFKDTDETLQWLALDMLLKKLASPEEIYVLKNKLNGNHGVLLDQHLQQLEGPSRAVSPQHSKSFL